MDINNKKPGLGGRRSFDYIFGTVAVQHRPEPQPLPKLPWLFYPLLILYLVLSIVFLPVTLINWLAAR